MSTFPEKEAQEVVILAENIAEQAYAQWQKSLESPTYRAPVFNVGDWVCEITSMFRHEHPIWRVGKVREREPSYKGSTDVFDYQIETLHGVCVNWFNCKMIPVNDTRAAVAATRRNVYRGNEIIQAGE